MEALLNIAVSNAVGAAVLAVIAAMVSRFCRRPVVRHALWLLVLLKLITPPLLPISVPWLRTEEAERPTAEAPSPAFDLSPVSEPNEDNISLPDVSEAAAPAADPPAAPLTFAEIGMPLVLAGWLAGSLVWWTLAAVRLRKFQRWLRQARPASAEVQEQARRLAVLLGVRRCPPVSFVSAPLSPLLWALGLSPRLLLPSELWPRLGAEQQDTLLAHELAHLRRGDHWIRHLELLVLGLYWWHPVVWWARRRLQEAEEECCDALVLAVLPDAASAYAAALVETVAFLSQARAAVLVGASGAGQVPLLKRRLTMILMDNSARKPSRLAFWIVLGLGALLLPLAPRAVRTEAPEEPAPKESPRRQHVKPQPAAAERDRSEEIEKLKDEIELLMVKVRLKETQLRARKVISAEFRRRYQTQVETNRVTPGTVSKDAMMETYIKMKTPELEAAEKEVELQESVIRLKQAERRLARLQPPTKRSSEPSSTKPSDRPFSHDSDSNDYEEARGFIDRIWPTLETKRVEDNIPKARKAFQICKNVSDHISLQRLLKGAKRHADRVAKELAELRPQLIADDVIPAKKLKKVSDQIIKLGQDIEDYLKAHADDKRQGALTPRQKRMLRWSIRFSSESGPDYVAQLQGLGALLAIPSREDGEKSDFKIFSLDKPKPKLLDKDISKIQRIYWIDENPDSVASVMTTLGLNLRPSRFIAFLPEELEQKLFRLEKSYLDKHHDGRTEDDILETTFRIKRVESRFEPEVVGQKVK